MLDKDFVPHQESLELKELGFDEPTIFVRTESGLLKHVLVSSYKGDYKGDYISKDSHDSRLNNPTFSQAFRFFRKKGYDIKIEKESEGLYFGFYWTGVAWIIVGEGSYEKAELECLRKLMEIVKNK